MIYWTGICWACTKCGSAFGWTCPICGANPENTKHSKECCCKRCSEEALLKVTNA